MSLISVFFYFEVFPKGGRLSVPAISINIGSVPDNSGFLQHRNSFKLSNSCQFLNQYGEEARSSFARRPSSCLSIGSDHFDLKLYQNCSVRYVSGHRLI